MLSFFKPGFEFFLSGFFPNTLTAPSTTTAGVPKIKNQQSPARKCGHLAVPGSKLFNGLSLVGIA